MAESKFKLVSDYQLKGDQPEAVESLFDNLSKGDKHQVLLGVTGSGKTFTMANVIARANRPALVIVHNKTLAAQLYGEFKELFPENAVEFFVSYYDYYQPEAYIPRSDTYIEKDSSINERIDRLRHSATRSLLTRRDVIIVASVSCIYGLGSPDFYQLMHLVLKKGDVILREEILRRLVDMQYNRNDYDFSRGTFRVRGDTIEIIPSYEDEAAIRIELFGDEIEALKEVDPLRGKVIHETDSVVIFPNSHYVTPKDMLVKALDSIRIELSERCKELRSIDKLLEEQRLSQRTLYDLEMMAEMGYCTGIENYSRHLDGRPQGTPPYTLLDYFPKDFLLFIDESHQTIPQLHAMYRGDHSRKSTLVEYGFRLPSALDNRPLTFEEFEERAHQVIYVSATPGPYELQMTSRKIVEQIIRPTGLLDPIIEVKPATNQVDDLLEQIRQRLENNQRALITTLTKRMAEDLTEYYHKLGIPVRYLHSDIDTLERTIIIRDLRLGEFDVLVGINLLREGLDLPEVSLVAILDADKEGFLRSETSLIQTCGRAARHVEGKVIFYADVITQSMKRAIDETNRRRKIQEAYNIENNITPESIVKNINNILSSVYERDYYTVDIKHPLFENKILPEDIPKLIAQLTDHMFAAAKDLDFEKAAELRDKIRQLEKYEIGISRSAVSIAPQHIKK